MQVNTLADEDILSLLQKYNVKPSKRFGQSFLKNIEVAKRIVGHAEITREDIVLEIGGGLGVLTEELIKAAGCVHVIEIEHGLVNALQDRFKDSDNLNIIEGDALVVDIPKVNKVVSNLPYSISSEITFRLLRESNFEQAILMFQKEFAQRLFAEPRTQDYSRLTVNIQYQAEIEFLFDVPAQMFYPRPAVDSVVVQMKHKFDGPRAKDDSIFFWTVNGIFSYPNKNLRRALMIWLQNIGTERTLADKLILSCGGNPRGENKLRTLSIKQLITLADVVCDYIEKKQIPDPRGK